MKNDGEIIAQSRLPVRQLDALRSEPGLPFIPRRLVAEELELEDIAGLIELRRDIGCAHGSDTFVDEGLDVHVGPPASAEANAGVDIGVHVEVDRLVRRADPDVEIRVPLLKILQLGD